MKTKRDCDNPYIRSAEESNKLLRLDKNVANSIDQIIDLSKALGAEDDSYLTTEDKNMINNIIFFMCHTKQNDLYGFGSINTKEFADFVKVKEGYLRTRHPNPLQLRGKRKEEIKMLYERQKLDPTCRIYDSILENALYTLNQIPLNFKASAKELVQDGHATKYILLSKSYILLEELETIIIKGKRGEPRVSYNYVLHEKFRKNLSLYFMRFDVKSVISLRRAGLDELYIYLKNLKDTFLEKKKAGESYDRRLNFNQMCSLAGIPRYTKEGNEYKNPRKIKYNLNAAFIRLINETDLKFKIEWSKYSEGSLGNYVPNIYFEEVEQYEKSKGHEMYMKGVIYQERLLIFKQNLILELIKTYKNHNTERDNLEKRILEWVASEKDIESKTLAFRTAQYESYGIIHPNMDKIINEWKGKIKKLTDMNEIIAHIKIE